MGLLKGILIMSVANRNTIRACSKYGVELIYRDIAVNPAWLGAVGWPSTKDQDRADGGSRAAEAVTCLEISARHPRDTSHSAPGKRRVSSLDISTGTRLSRDTCVEHGFQSRDTCETERCRGRHNLPPLCQITLYSVTKPYPGTPKETLVVYTHTTTTTEPPTHPLT